MRNAWAIGLYSYSTPYPGGEGFKEFYDSVSRIFGLIGVNPTYFAADGDGYNGHLTKCGSQTHSKALRTEFSGVNAVSLVANPVESDEPGYDSYASASLGFVEESGETLLCFYMEEKFMRFGGESFERVLFSLAAMRYWDFGYALCQPVEKKPEFHVLGLDSGELCEEELKELTAWYASFPEERVRKLRDIYPYIVLNGAQLAARISSSQTVEDIAMLDGRTILTKIENTSLWLWKIKPDAVGDIRHKMAESGVLISCGPRAKL